MNDTTIWIIPVIATLTFVICTVINQMRDEIKRTNSILERIAKQIGVPEPPVDNVIKALVAEGKKIEAVKR